VSGVWASAVALAVISMGGLGVFGRSGRPGRGQRLLSSLRSGACCLIAACFGIILPTCVCLIWGFAIVADLAILRRISELCRTSSWTLTLQTLAC
jgi:hypothetical protein